MSAAKPADGTMPATEPDPVLVAQFMANLGLPHAEAVRMARTVTESIATHKRGQS